MTKFNVGDTVYIKDEVVERCKKYSEKAGAVVAFAPSSQIALAKGIPFTIVDIRSIYYYLTNFNDNWGAYQNVPLWNGRQYKTWIFHLDELEKRDMNTISLFELNRGL